MSESTENETMPEAVSIIDDVMHASAQQLRLAAPQEWQEPRGHLYINVNPSQGGANISMTGYEFNTDLFDWNSDPTTLKEPIDNVRKAAEKFRGFAESYLNNIEGEELAARLKKFAHVPGEFLSDAYLTPEHQAEWERIAVSDEMRELAYSGHVLYQILFPPGSDLYEICQRLEPDWKLNITWWNSSIPWGLLYEAKPPSAGQPVDATQFWGLRYRIRYMAHKDQTGKKIPDKGLGDWDKTYRGCCLYWGDEQATAQESRWQQAAWANLTNQVFVPGTKEKTQYKEEVRRLLGHPNPAPMPFLYLFCYYDMRDGKPELRFGNTRQPPDIIGQMDIDPGEPLEAKPLVFINACMTAGADVYIANALEQIFFRRGCRAYIGTETKVPIQLASRFAYTFCQFFYRLMDKKLMAAGEAIYQTRRFLWNQYRNIGGLFYTYINQYDLFLADEDEVKSLRR